MLHRSVILLQPEFLMKCVSRVWFCNQFPFCIGRSRHMAAFLFPKFEPEPHIYTYIPPVPKNNPKTHKRSGITIFWGDLSFLSPLSGWWAYQLFDSRVGLILDNCYGIYTPNVAPRKDHFKTQKHVIHLSGDHSVLLEGFTTLRDSTYFFEVQILFFVGDISSPL